MSFMNPRLGAGNTLGASMFALGVSFPVVMRLSVRFMRLSVIFQWFMRLSVSVAALGRELPGVFGAGRNYFMLGVSQA